jgi:hypothetical protein
MGEAIAIEWSDFDGHALHVCRRIYEGCEDALKTAKSEQVFEFRRCFSCG